LKQLVQDIRSGKSVVADVPAPRVRRGHLLVETRASLVSAGTERMVVEFAEKNLVEKARSRPDLVRQVFDKARRDGILPTLEAVQNRLDQPMALGYSIAGVVIEVGDGITEFHIGDRIAAAGGGFAVHAEVVSIPRNLAVHLSPDVPFEEAAFTTLGAIALQGLRIGEVRVGDIVAVVGLGLLGQLTIQLLRAAGCRPVGFDPQAVRVELAMTCGAEAAAATEEQFEALCSSATGGRGVDSVLITADTPSDAPVALAGRVARDRGVVVAVGAVGLNVPRKTFYEKELDLRLSRSYGPGRYDDAYELEGVDYPYGYVRWTENRNMQAFVDMLRTKAVRVAPLISHRLPIDDGARGYELITGKTGEPFLGVVLTYPERERVAGETRIDIAPAVTGGSKAKLSIGLLGAGNYAKATLLPAIERSGKGILTGVATASGFSAKYVAEKYHFRYCTTDSRQVIDDPDINAVVIATRHHLHAKQTADALRAGKHVFVEKPICLTPEELASISEARRAAEPRVLMVGFNRRFAPMAVKLKDWFRDAKEPLMLQYRVNAGFLPANHWTQDPAQGGGRLLGECIHFIDWAIWLCDSLPLRVHAARLASAARYSDDNFAITIEMQNGSVANIVYVANGAPALGKEYVEIHGGGRSGRLEDYRLLELFRGTSRSVERARLRSDKGHAAGWAAFASAVESGAQSPVPFEQIVEGMRAAFAAIESMATGASVAIERK
jgi:predicted dehydrogenase/threonine dehydrogenase-like Zn-dependent dehydrogenase